jgi:tetrahydromethanopterin S-methyltransferase subunit A
MSRFIALESALKTKLVSIYSLVRNILTTPCVTKRAYILAGSLAVGWLNGLAVEVLFDRGRVEADKVGCRTIPFLLSTKGIVLDGEV